MVDGRSHGGLPRRGWQGGCIHQCIWDPSRKCLASHPNSEPRAFSGASQSEGALLGCVLPAVGAVARATFLGEAPVGLWGCGEWEVEINRVRSGAGAPEGGRASAEWLDLG